MQKTDTKQNLIRAVRELIASGENFTVKDITSRAYTNVAAINYYFGDKNTLVNMVLDEIIGGYRQMVLDELKCEYSSNAEYVEAFLDLVLRIYSENKGVIRYIVLADTGSKSHFIDNFLFDPELTELVFAKMRQETGEQNQEVMLCNYMIAISSFIIPLLFEVQNAGADGGVNLSVLENETMRKVFVTQLMKLFT